MDEKVRLIAERLAKLSPDAQEEELAKIERNVTKREVKAQKTALDTHKVGIADHAVQTVILYCQENKIDIKTILPLNIKISESEDGRGITGAVSGKGRSGGSDGNGTRGASFLKNAGVTEIKLNDTAIKRCAEIQVLRDLYGPDKAKEKVGSASAHKVCVQPEVVSDIRKAGFVAIFEDGSEILLADVYKTS